MIRFSRGRTKEKNDGHMERYQAVRYGYEIKYYIKQELYHLQESMTDSDIIAAFQQILLPLAYEVSWIHKLGYVFCVYVSL